MKIVVIAGSPRKGNTYQVVRKTEEAMQKSCSVEFDYVFLKDLNLQMCRGCFQCIQKGNSVCPLKDDQSMILEKMLGSDGIILATPAYNFNVSSLMKNFIDRFAYIGHQPLFFRQHLLIVSTTAGTGLNEVKKYLTKYVARLWGFSSSTFLGLLTPPYQKPDKMVSQDNKKIEKACRQFCQHIRSGSESLKYYHMEQFCCMRAIFTLEGMKDVFPADYAFYRSLRGKRYFYNTKVNRIKYTLACMQGRLLRGFISTTIKK